MATALLKLTDVQLGTSVTATNNFTIYQPSTPDGTVRLGNGNSGSVTDIMTLNSSGNVGIGTSSPASKLDVNGVGKFGAVSVGGVTGTAFNIEYGSSIGYVWNYANGGIIFGTNNAQKMLLDSSGNLGLGVTPSAWASGRPAIEASGFSLQSYNANYLGLGQNEYVNSSLQYIYKTTAAASLYTQISGAHAWYTAPSGTAGNAITFTQAMTLDASGNLGLGTTSPTATAATTTLQISGDLVGQLLVSGTRTNTVTGKFIGNTFDDTVQVGSVTNNPFVFTTNDTERMRINASGNVGIGTSSPAVRLHTAINSSSTNSPFIGDDNVAVRLQNTSNTAGNGAYIQNADSGGRVNAYVGFLNVDQNYASAITFGTAVSGASNYGERMRIDSSGRLIVGKTTDAFGTNGVVIDPAATDAGVYSTNTRTDGGGGLFFCNRQGSDGPLVLFYQASTQEGSISVSGTTVSYNGGHLSRWSQWQNETGQPEVYRGTVLESTDDMCEWYDEEGQLLPNEQATKTIVSTTEASKAVAGVFDVYDIADHTNPFDFYVAQSGDFVIRIAQGVVVQNGDLLESAGDGTARPQADDICRSSTVAKVTSNKVVETYQDGSFCVPCILMIG